LRLALSSQARGIRNARASSTDLPAAGQAGSSGHHGGRSAWQRRRALAADVGSEAERLYRIVEDLVALVRSERGDLHPAREPVAVGRMIASAVEHELGRNPELHIRYLGASDAAADEADEGLFGHVLRNLLDNATRYNARGATIDVIVDIEGDEVVVRVLDEGPEPSNPVRQDVIDPGATRAGLTGGASACSSRRDWSRRWTVEAGHGPGRVVAPSSVLPCCGRLPSVAESRHPPGSRAAAERRSSLVRGVVR
jgi:signal transduction histidine kinase